MERNIAALLDPRAYTVHVQYQHSQNETEYTYITNIAGIKEGDYVVVPTLVRQNMQAKLDGIKRTSSLRIKPLTDGGPIPGAEECVSAIKRMLSVGSARLSIALVTNVDSAVEIPPDDEIEYAWIIQRVDFTAYGATLDRNKQITDAVADAYKRNVRKSFAERIMGELPDGARASLQNLLGGK